MAHVVLMCLFCPFWRNWFLWIVAWFCFVFLYAILNLTQLGISLDQPGVLRIILITAHLRNDWTQQPWKALRDDDREASWKINVLPRKMTAKGNLNLIPYHPQVIRKNIFNKKPRFFCSSQPMANLEAFEGYILKRKNTVETFFSWSGMAE